MRRVSLDQDLLPRHRSVLRAIRIIAERYPADDWCLVGGMMVLIASRDAGAPAPRAEETNDADLVVDLCADPELLRDMAAQLRVIGFNPPPPFYGEGFARCTFASSSGQIDLLAPEDVDEALLQIDAESHTIAIPGGRRALELAEPVEIYYDEESFDVQLRVPLLPGALVVKAAAVLDARTSHQSQHLSDVAHMLGALPDPMEARTALGADDRTMLDQLRDRLEAEGSDIWSGAPVDFRERARAALAIVTG